MGGQDFRKGEMNMAHLGQFKAPVLPLAEAHKRAMEMIDACEEGVAIFMVGGKLTSSKKKSAKYPVRLRTLANNLVGVYDWHVDPRYVLADIEEFYRIAEQSKVPA